MSEIIYHKELALSGRWHTFTLMEQLGNVGSEVNRTMMHFEKNKTEAALNAFYRALELLDLTINDPRWINRLKELVRMREVMCDLFVGDNEFNTSYDFLKKYFYHFGYAARNEREKKLINKQNLL